MTPLSLSKILSGSRTLSTSQSGPWSRGPKLPDRDAHRTLLGLTLDDQSHLFDALLPKDAGCSSNSARASFSCSALTIRRPGAGSGCATGRKLREQTWMRQSGVHRVN
jgi:hypothetical protein